MNVFFGIFNPTGHYGDLNSKNMANAFLNSEYERSSEYRSESFFVSEYISKVEASSNDCSCCFYETKDWVVSGYLSLSYRGSLLDKLGFYDDVDLIKSDAELVLRAFVKWGDECVDHIEGEWCFLVYDKKWNSLKVFKDFSGVSSFYYFLKEGTLYFSSFSSVLTQAFRAFMVPDMQSILRITSLKFVPHGGNTVFSNLKSLVQGQRLSYSHEKNMILHSNFPDKFGESVNYKFLEDYTEDFNQLFFGAVREIARKGRKIALFLSGGKDSSSVGYYLSQLGKYSGNVYQAFTSVPAYTIKDEFVGNRLYDESDFVNEMISAYPNMDIRLMNFKDESIVSAFQGHFDLNAFFPVVTKNSYWLKGILNEGKRSGVDTFVTGQMGNFTITSNSFYLYADKFKRFDIFGLLRSFLHEHKKWNVGLGYFIKHYVLIPLKQLWLLHFRALVSEHRKFEYSCLQKDICRADGKITPKNHLNILLNFFKRNKLLRHELLKINLEFSANAWSHLGISHGVKIFDPTSDFRLISYLYSIPQTLFFQKKTSKFLFRQLMKGRIPEKILINDQYHNQSFDFPLKFISDKEFSHFFESAMRSPGKKTLMNLARIRKAYEYSNQENKENYTGININLFLNNFSVYLFLKSEN